MEASSVKEKSAAYKEGVEYLVSLEPDIRKEAWELKDCCTRYAFQGITLLTTAYAIIGRLIFSSINVGFVGAILAVLCIVLISLITYKYGSSNRVYGYLLHLQRSNPLKSNLTDEFSPLEQKSDYGWGPWMRFIGWEEALRAWRVVQPTIYFAVYEDPLDQMRKNERDLWNTPNFTSRTLVRIKTFLNALKTITTIHPWPRLRKAYREQGEYRWFIPRVLVAHQAAYNSGNYLKKLCTILFFLLFVGYAFLCGTVVTRGIKSQGTSLDWVAVTSSLFVTGMIIYYVSARLFKKTDRLESELESIHSCAVLWQITIVAHYRALRYCRLFFGSENYRYTFMLSVQALHLVEFGVSRAHEWIESQDEQSFMDLLYKKSSDIANDADKKKLLVALTRHRNDIEKIVQGQAPLKR